MAADVSAGGTGSPSLRGAPGGDVPAPGARVVLMCTGSQLVVGIAELLAWDTSSSGLVVTACVRVLEDDVAVFADAGVWASTRTGPDGSLVVLSGLARATGPGSRDLQLTGVGSLAHEVRRRAVRARLRRPACVVGGGRLLRGRTVDLSSAGCRVELDELPVETGPGQHVVLDLELDPDHGLLAPACISRVDPDERQVVVLFDPMGEADARRIDHTVYGLLSAGA